MQGGGINRMTMMTWNDDLAKRVRTGDWPDQAISTVKKIEDAIAAETWESAAELVDYFMEEAKVVHMIYSVWFPGFLEWLRLQALEQTEIDAELDRIKRLIPFTDGGPFDMNKRWADLGAQAGHLGTRLRAQDIGKEEAVAELDSLREGWRQLHDRWVDMISGVLGFVAKRFGEDRLEELYRHVLEPYIQERYMPFDLRENDYGDTIYRNLYISLEAMRAHLCGPERRGDLELAEHEDRWEIRFDPCGSGGRSTRGDAIEGTGSRVLPPYEFGVTQAKHDWAWNEEGVCYYCAHCCFALERLPAERWGHPVRVVDSPRFPSETTGATPKKCKWTIYKTLDAIPPEAYERIGMKKPAQGQP